MQGVGVDMAGVEIGVDGAELERVFKALKKYPKSAEKALIRTVNDTAQRTVAPLKTEITAKYNIKKKDLSGGNAYKSENSNNLIKVKKVNNLQQNAKIEVRGSSLTLQRFVKGEKTPSHIRRKNVVVQVKKGNAATLNNRTFLQYAHGSIQVMSRRSGERHISRLLKTTSTAQMASNDEVSKAVQEKSQEVLKKRADHYIELELKKIKG